MKKWIAAIGVIGSLLVLATCPNPLDKVMLLRVKDEQSALIKILSPAPESYCANVAEVTGEVKDTATATGDTGKVKSLSYEVAGTTVGGQIAIAADGSFDFQFSTVTLSSNFTLSLMATDWNNNTSTVLLPLRKMTETGLPYFTAKTGNRQVILEWQKVPKAAGYTLYYTTNGSLPSENTGTKVDIANTQSSWQLGNLTNGSMHVFRLKAIPEPGWPESWSDYAKAIPLSKRTLNVRASAGFKQIRIDWDSIAATDTFEVFKSVDIDGPFYNLSGPISRNNYTDTDVVNGAWYYYRVRPNISGGITSAIVGVKTDPFPSTIPLYISTCDTPHWATGVTISGNYAYVLDDDAGLQVIDISSPGAPRLIGSHGISCHPEEAAVSGQYVYVAAGGCGLQVFSVANPAAPEYLGGLSVGLANGVAVSGNYAYVASSAGLAVIDITTPTTPALVATCAIANSGENVKVRGGYAYLVCFSGLYIIDISNPLDPQLKSTCNMTGVAWSVAIQGDYAYIADGDSGLRIVDITDPTSPVLKGSCGTTNTAFGIAVRGKYAFVAAHNAGLHMIDVSNPLAPVIKSTFNTTGQSMDVCLAGDYAYVADTVPGMVVLNVANPMSPVQVGNSGSTGVVCISTIGKYACVALDKDFGVLDIFNPSAPSLLGSCPVSEYVLDVAVAGEYAFAACSRNAGLVSIDIATPSAPVVRRKLPTPDHCTGIALSGDYAYLSTWVGLIVADISDPASPVITGSCATRFAQGVAVSGRYAYVADYDNGLRVIDINNPNMPVIVGTAGPMLDAVGVYVRGSYAYVADNDYAGLHVVDISSPTTPAVVGTCSTPGQPMDVFVRGKYAYVAADNGGLQVVDISDPASPTIVGACPTTGYNAYGIVVDGYHAYVADYDGLSVIDLFPE